MNSLLKRKIEDCFSTFGITAFHWIVVQAKYHQSQLLKRAYTLKPYGNRKEKMGCVLSLLAKLLFYSLQLSAGQWIPPLVSILRLRFRDLLGLNHRADLHTILKGAFPG